MKKNDLEDSQFAKLYCSVDSYSEAPKGWAIGDFDQVLSDVTDSKAKLLSSEMAETGLYPVVDQGQKYISGYTDDKNLVRSFQSPVVVFGDHTRSFKLVTIPLVQGADGTRVLLPKHDEMSKFVYCFFQSLRLPNKGYSRHYKFLKQVKIPIPPLGEQKRIVAKIVSTQEKIKTIEQSVTKAEELISEYREALLQKAFRGEFSYPKNSKQLQHEQHLQLTRTPDRAVEKLPKLPKNWVWTNLKAVSDKVIDCHNKTAPYKETGIVLVRTSNFRNDVLDLETVKYIDDTAFLTWAKRGAPKYGDILFTREAPLGKVALVPANPTICMGQRMMLISPNTKVINRDYLFAVLRSSYVLDYLNTLSIGATVKHARVRDVETLPIPLPSVDEQVFLAKYINECIVRATGLESLLTELKRKSKEIESSVLKAAFAGKLVMQDPSEGTGSALLEKLVRTPQAKSLQTKIRTNQNSKEKKKSRGSK